MSSSSKQVLTSDGAVVAAKKCKFEIIHLPTKSTTRINVLQNLKLTPKLDFCTSIDAVLQHQFPINQIEDVIADIQSHCGATLLKNVCDELHEHLTPSTYSRSSLTSLPDPFHEVMDISCTCHDIQNTQVCLEHVGCETVSNVNVKSVESSTAEDLSGPVDGQLRVSKREVCYFVIWTPLRMEVQQIHRDDLFWSEKMQKLLVEFYHKCMMLVLSTTVVPGNGSYNIKYPRPGLLIEEFGRTRVIRGQLRLDMAIDISSFDYDVQQINKTIEQMKELCDNTMKLLEEPVLAPSDHFGKLQDKAQEIQQSQSHTYWHRINTTTTVINLTTITLIVITGSAILITWKLLKKRQEKPVNRAQFMLNPLPTDDNSDRGDTEAAEDSNQPLRTDDARQNV
ncbi:hypothetical protein RN001_013627 [Aquatica leii]|uniref:Uncharacterized protein n=1 Tax=Aquatica leii TaxID=1421715 RepID=A0AAN7PRZ8_9COLE|nr:hypothetical protein RN001_013627 [Aquatica leii]